MCTIPTDNIELYEVTDLGSPDYVETIQLYQQLFPLEEQKPLEQVASMIENKTYTLIVARHPSFEGIIGFAFVMFNSDPEFLFIDNIAIREELQGHGFGTSFFKSLIERQSAQSLGVFLEIEIPELAADDADRIVREKRIEFYQRLGCIPLENVDYLFPRKGEAPLPLLLMFRPSPHIKELPSSVLKEMILSIYNKVHYDVPERMALFMSYAHAIPDFLF